VEQQHAPVFNVDVEAAQLQDFGSAHPDCDRMADDGAQSFWAFMQQKRRLGRLKIADATGRHFQQFDHLYRADRNDLPILIAQWSTCRHGKQKGRSGERPLGSYSRN